MSRNRVSGITLVLMIGFMLGCCTWFYPRYKQPGANATISWDAAGYYWYLPSVFIYQDLREQHWADSLIQKYQPGPPDMSGFGFQARPGNWVFKYPAGMAVLETPFFLAAHALAKPLGYPADGFSLPYQAGIQWGALLVAFLGLWGLRRLLLNYYSDSVVAAILAILVVGTNYLNYSAIDGAIAHSWLFTLYVFLMLGSRRFYMKPSNPLGAALGALCGLAALIRPTDAIAVLIPLLWGLELKKQVIKARVEFWRKHLPALILAVVCGVAVLSLQLFYWKYSSGAWLVYSYQDQGFSWLHPHVADYVFSYKSGWLVYTPVMLPAVLGFIPFIRSGQSRLMVCVFSLIAFYMVTAWDIWWYAGMGGRAMVQYYAVLAFPMASAMSWVTGSRLRLWLALPVILLLTYVNIWFTWHAHRGKLYDANLGMTGAYYWRVIGRWTAPPEVERLKDGRYYYEGQIPENHKTIYPFLPERAIVLDSASEVSQTIKFAIPSGRDVHWLRASADFYTTSKEQDIWKMTQLILGVRRSGDVLRESGVRVQRFIPEGEPVRVFVDLKLPSGLQPGDSGSVHLWNPGSKKTIRMQNLRVEGW